MMWFPPPSVHISRTLPETVELVVPTVPGALETADWNSSLRSSYSMVMLYPAIPGLLERSTGTVTVFPGAPVILPQVKTRGSVTVVPEGTKVVSEGATVGKEGVSDGSEGEAEASEEGVLSEGRVGAFEDFPWVPWPQPAKIIHRIKRIGRTGSVFWDHPEKRRFFIEVSFRFRN